MPVLDGWRFLELLRQQGPSIPVIVATVSTVISQEWAEAHGCAGLLHKPFDLDELRREVQRLLPPNQETDAS